MNLINICCGGTLLKREDGYFRSVQGANEGPHIDPKENIVLKSGFLVL